MKYFLVIFLLLAIPAKAEIASWYEHGTITANGESYKPEKLTAAHRTLAFGSYVRVINNETGQSVVVRINDNGPFIKGRSIDLSRGAFRKLSPLSTGLLDVRIIVLRRAGPDRKVTGKEFDR